MNFKPVMSKVKRVTIIECGIVKQVYERGVSKWILKGNPNEGEPTELTTRTMMDIIISSYVAHNCHVSWNDGEDMYIYIHNKITV